MNIFVSDYDPTKAAQNLDDLRLTHMPKECIEFLAIFIWINTHKWIAPMPFWTKQDEVRRMGDIMKSPINKWLREDPTHITWLYRHFIALCMECLYRFNEGSVENIRDFEDVEFKNPYINSIKRWFAIQLLIEKRIEPYLDRENVCTKFYNSSMYKEEKNIIKAYRKTLITKWETIDKKAPKWTRRGEPNWLKDFEESQLNLL